MPNAEINAAATKAETLVRNVFPTRSAAEKHDDFVFFLSVLHKKHWVRFEDLCFITVPDLEKPFFLFSAYVILQTMQNNRAQCHNLGFKPESEERPEEGKIDLSTRRSGKQLH